MKREFFFIYGLFVAIFTASSAAAQTSRGVVYTPPRGHEQGLKGETEIYRRSVAVVIGIDDYRNNNIGDLKGAVRDARRVASVFEARGMSVKMFLDHEATQRAIKAYLGDTLLHTIGGDQVPSGRIGVGTYNATARFDNVRVTLL